jgi:hypothetical protein
MEDGSQQSQHQAAESVQTEVKSEQQVDGPSGQPQQQETSTEPLTS